MKGWQAAAGFLGVGTVISLLSLIGDTTSYDETKYKVAGHWADTTTERRPSSSRGIEISPPRSST